MDERQKNKELERDDRKETPPHGDPVRTGAHGSRPGEAKPDLDKTDESVGADRDSNATGQL